MLAIVKVKEGAGGIEVRDVPKPRVTDPNQVLVRVRAAGICGSDLHVYGGKLPCDIPVIMGHEFSGEIVEVGSGASHWEIGDRVVSECNVDYCGMCAYCRTDRPHLCVSRGSIGRQRDGVFAEYLLLEPNQLHRIPDEVTFEQAALAEPAANAVHHVLERGTIEPEDFVVVSGPGPIGLLNAQAARAGGAGRVIVTGVTQDVPLRLEAARALSFETANVQEVDIVDLQLGAGLHGLGARPCHDRLWKDQRGPPDHGHHPLRGLGRGLPRPSEGREHKNPPRPTFLAHRCPPATFRVPKGAIINVHLHQEGAIAMEEGSPS